MIMIDMLIMIIQMSRVDDVVWKLCRGIGGGQDKKLRPMSTKETSALLGDDDDDDEDKEADDDDDDDKEANDDDDDDYKEADVN